MLQSDCDDDVLEVFFVHAGKEKKGRCSWHLPSLTFAKKRRPLTIIIICFGGSRF